MNIGFKIRPWIIPLFLMVLILVPAISVYRYILQENEKFASGRMIEATTSNLRIIEQKNNELKGSLPERTYGNMLLDGDSHSNSDADARLILAFTNLLLQLGTDSCQVLDKKILKEQMTVRQDISKSSIIVLLSCNTRQLSFFLNALEREEFLIEIKKISIAREFNSASEATQKLSVDMTLTSYYKSQK